MSEINVGKLLTIQYNTETKEMRITIDIIDEMFKEQILRNNELKDKIQISGNDLLWIASK